MGDLLGSNEMNVAVFGYGRIGQVHYNNILNGKRLHVKYIVEEDITRAYSLLGSTPGTHIIKPENAKQVYDDDSVIGVIICTPSFTHEKLVKAALSSGKSVFCEKPLAPSLEDTRECFRLADQVHRPLFCAFNRRFDPQLMKIHKEIKSGKVGKVRMVKTISRDPPGMATKQYIETSGGIFIDSAIHDIDVVCWLVGEAPTNIYATGAATSHLYADCGDVDSCSISLNFPSGALGTIEVSRNAPHGYDQRVEVMGTEALLQSDNKRETSVLRWTSEGALEDPIYTDCVKRYTDSYKHEMQHFTDILAGDSLPEVTANSTMLANTIACACQASLRTQQVVNLADVM